MALLRYYKDLLNEALTSLAKRYKLTRCLPNEEDYPENLPRLKAYDVWRVDIDGHAEVQELLVAIPSTFPDALPKIYLPKDAFSRIYPIPHVDRHRFVCTRDSDQVFIAEDMAGEAIEDLVSIALDIIHKGVSGTNHREFEREFLAYWEDADNTVEVMGLLPSSVIKREVCVAVVPSGQSARVYGVLATTCRQATRWLYRAGLLNKDNLGQSPYPTVYEALLVHLSEIPTRLPEDFQGIMEMLETCSSVEISAITGLIANHYRAHIFASVPVAGASVYIGWLFVGCKSALAEGGNNARSIKPRRIKVNMANSSRLQIRAGCGYEEKLESKRVGLVGCGAVGGAFALSLVGMGYRTLYLYDRDTLRLENIPRHVCDVTHLGENKAVAVASMAMKKAPHVDCFALKGDFLDLVARRQVSLEKLDLLVSATADYPTERRICSYVRTSGLSTPIALLWVEPYGMAGHCLYLHPNAGACFSCLFTDAHFKYSVVTEDPPYAMRERGCQTSFVPYAVVDAQMIAAISCRFLTQFVLHPPYCSRLITWIGDTSKLEEYGISLQEEWAGVEPFSVHNISLSSDPRCSACSEGARDAI